jgi:predicted RNase H-like nuclease (RuvC/YqgF family)
MTKKEIVERINELGAKLDDMKATNRALANEVDEAIKMMDMLPSEVDEIDDDEDDETEDEKEPN